jgi:hypothetical protein
VTAVNRFDAASDTANGGTYTLHLNGNAIEVHRGDDFTVDGAHIVCDENGQVVMTSAVGGNAMFENNVYGDSLTNVVQADTINGLNLN